METTIYRHRYRVDAVEQRDLLLDVGLECGEIAYNIISDCWEFEVKL